MVTSFDMLACAFLTDSNLTLRTVEAAGEATTVVVVLVVMSAVLVRPGVTVVPSRSTHDAWTSTVLEALVMTLIRSEVLARLIML